MGPRIAGQDQRPGRTAGRETTQGQNEEGRAVVGPSQGSSLPIEGPTRREGHVRRAHGLTGTECARESSVQTQTSQTQTPESTDLD